jgi:hypothetical protein
VRRIIVAVVLAAMLVVGVVGYALGSIPSADDRIHACYPTNQLTDHKNVYLLDDDQADGQCPFGWTEIDWADD